MTPSFPLIPLKHLCREPVAYGTNESSDSYVPAGVRFLRTTDITDSGLLIPPEQGVYLPPELAADSMLRDGDILLSRSGTIGRSIHYRRALHGECAHAGYLVRFRPKANVDPRWLFYFSKSDLFFDQIAEDVIQSTISNFNGQKFANLRVPLPLEALQRCIADFLDRKTAAIDELIAKKERLALLLQEKRQAVITQAVTKGLDPDVRMKESGEPWLGQVPAHWRLLRGRFLMRPYGGYAPEALTEVATGVGYYKVDDLNLDGLGLYLPQASRTVDPTGLSLLPAPAIVIPKRGAAIFTNKVRIISHDSTVDSNVMGLSIIGGHSIDFLALCLWARSLRDLADVSTIPQINNKHIRDLVLAIPPRVEQQRVVDDVLRKVSQIDVLMRTSEIQVSRLREYRQSLITAAVTGKIDVGRDEGGIDDKLQALEASG